jgi:hypothetical protein
MRRRITLRQRICGFRGHQSTVFGVDYNHKAVTQVRLICEKCGYKTRWFRVPFRGEEEK